MNLDLMMLAEMAADKLHFMHQQISFPRNFEGLTYPCYSPNTSPKYACKLRLSEQETRLAYILCLEQIMRENGVVLQYSIETPTVMSYTGFSPKQTPVILPRNSESGQAGKCGSSSGQVDMSIYIPSIANACELMIKDMSLSEAINSMYMAVEEEPFIQYDPPAVNIEFKHGASNPLSIRKDVLKLMCENPVGVFVHSFVDNPKSRTGQSTLQSITGKYIEARSFAMNSIACYNAKGNMTQLSPGKEVYVFLLGLDPDGSSAPSVECYRLSNWQRV